MRYIICGVCLCLIISVGNPLEFKPIQAGTFQQDPSSSSQIPIKTDYSKALPARPKPKLEFPSKEMDDSTPIVIGDDPKKSKLPPKVFPTKQDNESTGTSIISGVDVRNTGINHNKENKMNSPKDIISDKDNVTVLENATKSEISPANKDKEEQETVEQEDMLHSKYKGGKDVDEIRPEKKASEKDEKKVFSPVKDPKSEVSVSSTLNRNGPKLMNDTKIKSGESMLESTSKMMAVSSSVLANSQPEQHGIIEPGKTVVSVLLTVVALLCFGAIGLLVWKRIAMRRFGRDVLINEDDFDEVSDMHTFDRAQIQIT